MRSSTFLPDFYVKVFFQIIYTNYFDKPLYLNLIFSIYLNQINPNCAEVVVFQNFKKTPLQINELLIIALF